MNYSSLLFAAFFLPAITVADELPTRAAGLWEITTSMNMMGQTMEEKAEQCIDEETDKVLLAAGMGQMRQAGGCTEPTFERSGSTYSSAASCELGGMKVKIRSTFTGDFKKYYKGESTMTYSPAPAPGMESQKVKFEGRLVGPCRAGQKPGDITVDGKTLNILSTDE